MIIGHQIQWQFLKKSAELERFSHAYLFSGPAQIGKKKVAFEFIKLLNCQSSGLKPCSNCRACKDIEKRLHPDFILVEPKNREIQIGEIRELRARLSLSSFSSRFKTVIVDRAHLLNKEAQSALLKILEEPRGETIFILISEFPQMLLPTIISRTEIIKFHPVENSVLECYLKSRGISETLAPELISLSFNKPGRLMDFLNNPSKRNFEQKVVKEISQLVNSDFAFRFQYAKNLSQDSQLLFETLDIWLRHFRDILFSKINSAPFCPKRCGIKKIENLKNQYYSSISNYSVKKLKKLLQLIQETNFLISTTNVNPRLALEILLIEL